MEPFDGNVLNYHHFMALFNGVDENKVEGPRGRHQPLHPIAIQWRFKIWKVSAREGIWKPT